MDRSTYLRGVADTLLFLHDTGDDGPIKVQETLDSMRTADKLTQPEYERLFNDLLAE